MNDIYGKSLRDILNLSNNDFIETLQVNNITNINGIVWSDDYNHIVYKPKPSVKVIEIEDIGIEI